MIRLIAIATLALIAVSGSAVAQDVQALIEKIDRLERDIRTMERAVYRGEAAKPASGGSRGDIVTSSGTLADAEARLSEMEDQMRRLTGTVEEVDNRIAQLEQRFDKLLRDIDLRFREIEQRLAPTADAAGAAGQSASQTSGQTATAPAASQAAQTQQPLSLSGKKPADDGSSSQAAAVADDPPPPAIQLPVGSTEDKYNFAMNLLRTHKYEQAEAAFATFLAEHRSDRLAGHAQYWLGETYYVRQNYDAAAKTYLTGYQQFPESAKAPDMLLKLAVTLGILGENEEACVILAELNSRFPDATSAIRNRARRERKKAGCG